MNNTSIIKTPTAAVAAVEGNHFPAAPTNSGVKNTTKPS